MAIGESVTAWGLCSVCVAEEGEVGERQEMGVYMVFTRTVLADVD